MPSISINLLYNGFIPLKYVSHKPLKKLDWDKLRNFVEEHKGEISDIFAGIKEDWDWTGDHVYSDRDGWIEPNMAYTESIWATPVARIWWKPEYDGIDEFYDFILEENK